jgi:hypothetical protein
VAVGAEAHAGCDAVFIDDAQRAELDVLRVHVIGKREAVIRLEPAVVCVTAILRGADFNHFDESPIQITASMCEWYADWL